MRIAISAFVFCVPLIALASSPKAAWEAFHERCLEPLEVSGEPNTEGLATDDKNSNQSTTAFSLEQGRLLISNSHPVSCSLAELEPGDMDRIGRHYNKWAVSGVYTDRYTTTPQIAPNTISMMSTDWRTPPIRVDILWPEANGGPGLRVTEVSE